MKVSTKIITALSLTFALGIGAAISLIYANGKAEKAEAYYSPSTTYSVSDTASELASYYSSISSSDSGTDLLGKLQSLNSTKRKKTVGYGTMDTSISTSPYIYTDYVLGSSSKDSNGQTYGTQIASFYTKTAATSWNREHMWPNSRGGSAVEGDILHTRPTISSENSSRGNSFYVEGMKSDKNGWDPYTAGYEEWVRGECARTILYCVVANSSFSLSDASVISNGETGYTSTMGDMDTLIKWHFAYTPNQYEINRNNGAEYLQGNRNPFVDHPEYVAKIWNNFNSNISTICSNNSSTYSSWTPGSCSTYGTNDAAGSGSTSTDPSATISGSTSVAVGSTTSLTAALSNVSSASDITWSSSNTSVATVSKGTTSTSSSAATVTGVAAGTATIYCKYSGTTIGQVSITVYVPGSSTSATFDFANGGNCSSTSGSATGVSFTTAQSSGTNAPIYSSSSYELRMYYSSSGNGNTFTLTPDSGYAITGVTITASSTSYTPTVKYNVDGGSDQTGSWSSTTMSISGVNASTSFVFRNANTSNKQLRIKSVDVTLQASGSTSTDPSATISGSTSVAVGSTTSLTAALSNVSSASDITWSSSNTSVATVSKGTTSTSSSAATVTGVAAGTATIYCKYSGTTIGQTTVTVTSASVTLSSIAVKTAPTKTSYTAGEYFEPAGLVITCTYSNNSTSDVTYSSSNSSSFTFTPSTSTALTTSNTSITISYGGKTTTQAITVTSGSSSSGKTYQVITSASELSAGDKVVIVGSLNSSYYYMTGSAKSSSLPWYIVGTSITPSNNQITGDDLTEWTVSKSGNYFSFTNNSNDLYGYVSGTHYSLNLGPSYTISGSTTNVVSSYSGVKTWTYTITDSSTGAATLYANSSSNVYLEYYNSSFCGYKSAPSSGSIFLYKEVTASTNGALTFAQTFLAAITCDSTGKNAPTFSSGNSWSQLATKFSSLDTADKNTLKTASASESGTDIQKAMAKYDYIVGKYGTSTYSNFIGRTITNVGGANGMNAISGNSTAGILLVICSISILGGFAFVGYWLKKKKER